MAAIEHIRHAPAGLPIHDRERDTIAEDSRFWKIATYIPLIGIVIEHYQTNSLRDKAKLEPQDEKKIRLIELINDYKSRSKLVFGAVIIASIVANILAGPVSIMANLISLLPLFYIYLDKGAEIRRNEMVIDELRAVNPPNPVRFLA